MNTCEKTLLQLALIGATLYACLFIARLAPPPPPQEETDRLLMQTRISSRVELVDGRMQYVYEYRKPNGSKTAFYADSEHRLFRVSETRPSDLATGYGEMTTVNEFRHRAYPDDPTGSQFVGGENVGTQSIVNKFLWYSGQEEEFLPQFRQVLAVTYVVPPKARML